MCVGGGVVGIKKAIINDNRGENIFLNFQSPCSLLNLPGLLVRRPVRTSDPRLASPASM